MTATATEKPTVSDVEKVAGCSITLLLIPFECALWSYVVATLWRWFVTPTFPLVPTLRPSVAFGLNALWLAARGYRPPEKAVQDADGWRLIIMMLGRGFAYPLSCLAFGYLALKAGAL